MENLLTIFIVVTAAAVVLQAGILVALFLTFKKTVEKMEVFAVDTGREHDGHRLAPKGRTNHRKPGAPATQDYSDC
jgi:hypothetical protein